MQASHDPQASTGSTGWQVVLVAAALAAIATGGRQVFGLFVSPLNTASGLGLAAISMALAIGQLGMGVAQPLLGRWADRAGPTRIVLAGSLVLALSTSLPLLSLAAPVLLSALALSTVAASAVGSNGLLLGAVGRAVSARHTGLAVGAVGAGASAGQLLLGPLLQWLIDSEGWRPALLAFAGAALLALPLALGLRRAGPSAAAGAARVAVEDILREWPFWRTALSFGACGLHIAFLGAHMSGAIERCGLPASLAGPWNGIAGAANIAGSIAIGLAMKRLQPGRLLASIYAVRAAAILGFMLLPTTVATLFAFALVMGASHMATLPPTTALVARRYGTARLGTLFGVVMLVHQSGSFLGVWLGGWLAQHTGSDQVFWTLDIALALAAAALVWPWQRSLAQVRRIAAPRLPRRLAALALVPSPLRKDMP